MRSSEKWSVWFDDDRVASLQKEMLPLMDKIKGDSDR